MIIECKDVKYEVHNHCDKEPKNYPVGYKNKIADGFMIEKLASGWRITRG